jgi:hypothetical protein
MIIIDYKYNVQILTSFTLQVVTAFSPNWYVSLDSFQVPEFQMGVVN